MCVHHAPLPVAGGKNNRCFLCFDCSTMQCNNVKKIQNSSQYQGNFPPLTPLFPITHAHTHVVLNSTPPYGELSLMECSPSFPLSQFTEAWQSLPGVSEWPINKEWLHASVLTQADRFQWCVNSPVHFLRSVQKTLKIFCRFWSHK